MGVHLATAALVTLAAAAPAHSARSHLPLSRHVAAASSFGSPRPARRPRPQGRSRRPRAAARRGRPDHVAHAAGDPAVTIADFHFTAPTTTIHVGDTITWTNDGPSPHTATASDGSFTTGTLSKGQSASHTFTRAGTFAYVCRIHPFMHGTIVVQAAATTAPAPATTTTPSPPASTTTPAAPAATTPAAAPPAPRPPTLPVTGMDLLSAIAAGAILAGAGLALRRAVRV